MGRKIGVGRGGVRWGGVIHEERRGRREALPSKDASWLTMRVIKAWQNNSLEPQATSPPK